MSGAGGASGAVEPGVLGADALRRMAGAARPAAAGCACASLHCPGWESLPPSFDATKLERLGRISATGGDTDIEPTLAEYHPAGTHYGSGDAPIALGHFPFNRCEVWRCRGCSRAFLRYTEFGGYYVEQRIRELRAGLIVDSTPPA